jgi:hypothetical protein
MKPILIIISFFFFAKISFAQRVQSSCDAPDLIKNKYREDAAWLAYQHELNTQSPYKDSVIIPRSLQDKFLTALSAVYNAKGLSEADTVTKYYVPRDFASPSVFKASHHFALENILFDLDTLIKWQERFAKRLASTGNSTFDSLIQKYAIIFDTLYYVYGPWRGITQIPYNIIVLDSLINITANLGSNFAHEDGVSMGSDWLGGVLKEDTVMLTYSIGWDDCFNGCIYRRFWHFTIFPDCTVQFDSSYGFPLPNHRSVDNNSQNKYFVISPNPASITIKIQTDPQSIIEILDLQGRVLLKELNQDESMEMDIASLVKGIYFVRAVNKVGKVMAGKFIKE